MTNEKFTQGSWRRAFNRSRSGNGNVRGRSHCRIENENGVVIAFTVPQSSKQEQVANTNLLATAKDMYECVCDALTDLEMPDGMRRHFEAVLEKARGEE